MRRFPGTTLHDVLWEWDAEHVDEAMALLHSEDDYAAREERRRKRE